MGSVNTKETVLCFFLPTYSRAKHTRIYIFTYTFEYTMEAPFTYNDSNKLLNRTLASMSERDHAALTTKCREGRLSTAMLSLDMAQQGVGVNTSVLHDYQAFLQRHDETDLDGVHSVAPNLFQFVASHECTLSDTTPVIINTQTDESMDDSERTCTKADIVSNKSIFAFSTGARRKGNKKGKERESGMAADTEERMGLQGSLTEPVRKLRELHIQNWPFSNKSASITSMKALKSAYENYCSNAPAMKQHQDEFWVRFFNLLIEEKFKQVQDQAMGQTNKLMSADAYTASVNCELIQEACHCMSNRYLSSWGSIPRFAAPDFVNNDGLNDIKSLYNRALKNFESALNLKMEDFDELNEKARKTTLQKFVIKSRRYKTDVWLSEYGFKNKDA